ncbi:hypothetical protein [Planotetraspora kaengkrachanensis]|uniref:Uncharacterized protein n=1 Tax=Planotetraspora kaengkrachanensis TaxID=575193 RepID=A0A8J3PYV8_9ACTN|nr:hypothetical protein [Planotetraspora kaengkrachanensis]GIG83557.1 hypothetical protein Pka01_66840 [Planotetraspora kaengkrachanensis]
MSAYAWPFLVARGRRLGYRTILAPGFLISAGEHGILDDTVVPDTQEDRATVVETQTSSGHRISIVHATHLVTAEDVAEPGTAPAERAPRDTHSRPLQLIYGFVCAGGGAAPPDPDDLRICREASLSAYRRFLADEEAFRVEAGHGFALRSHVREPEEMTRSSMPGIETADTAISTKMPSRAGVAILLVGAVTLISVVILAMMRLTATPEPAIPCPTPTAAVAGQTLPAKQPAAGKPGLKPKQSCIPQPPGEKPQPKKLDIMFLIKHFQKHPIRHDHAPKVTPHARLRA